ncbi:hypothetical protein ACFL59_05640 [Planctomycetota bacterium]
MIASTRSRLAVTLLSVLLCGVCALVAAPRAYGQDDDATNAAGDNARKALDSVNMAVTPTLTGDTVSVSYTFRPRSAVEPDDWIWLKRPDKVTLASASNTFEGVDGLDCRAGSLAVGKVVHKIQLAPPCAIELDFFLWYSGPNSRFAITLCEPKPTKGLAIDWGRQLVRKGGKNARIRKGFAREEMRSGTDYRVRCEVRDGRLVTTMNGAKLVDEELKPKEMLPGTIGFEIHDARVIIRTITLEGKVDPKWAAKHAKKARR